jgi:hypothetical protein
MFYVQIGKTKRKNNRAMEHACTDLSNQRNAYKSAKMDTNRVNLNEVGRGNLIFITNRKRERAAYAE